MRYTEGIQLRTKHDGDILVGHAGQRHRSAGESRQIDALKSREIGTEPLEERRHSNFVCGVSSDLDEGRPRR